MKRRHYSSEKRVHPRHTHRQAAELHFPDGTVVTTHTKDVAIGGVFVELEAEVEVDVQIVLAVKLGAAAQELLLPAKVVRLISGSGGVLVGAGVQLIHTRWTRPAWEKHVRRVELLAPA